MKTEAQKLSCGLCAWSARGADENPPAAYSHAGL